MFNTADGEIACLVDFVILGSVVRDIEVAVVVLRTLFPAAFEVFLSTAAAAGCPLPLPLSLDLSGPPYTDVIE
jgi:hypothetical protein